jgi:hypothetical protein
MVATSAKRHICLLVGCLLISLTTGKINAETPSLPTGIEGVISVSPSHGGPTRAGEVDSAPLADMAFDAVNNAGSVVSFTTDSSGRFRVSLAPGRYSIKLHDAKKKWPRCGPFEIEVPADGFKKIQWECDSGMR